MKSLPIDPTSPLGRNLLEDFAKYRAEDPFHRSVETYIDPARFADPLNIGRQRVRELLEGHQPEPKDAGDLRERIARDMAALAKLLKPDMPAGRVLDEIAMRMVEDASALIAGEQDDEPPLELGETMRVIEATQNVTLISIPPGFGKTLDYRPRRRLNVYARTPQDEEAVVTALTDLKALRDTEPGRNSIDWDTTWDDVESGN